MTAREKLDIRLDAFLKEKRKSDGGGWAEITEEDMGDLYDIVHRIVGLKCEKDADGDLPIEVALTNRRTHRRMHYRPIPYDLDTKSYDLQGTAEMAWEALDIAMFNLTIMTKEVDMLMRIYKDRKEDEA